MGCFEKGAPQGWVPSAPKTPLLAPQPTSSILPAALKMLLTSTKAKPPADGNSSPARLLAGEKDSFRRKPTEINLSLRRSQCPAAFKLGVGSHLITS